MAIAIKANYFLIFRFKWVYLWNLIKILLLVFRWTFFIRAEYTIALLWFHLFHVYYIQPRLFYLVWFFGLLSTLRRPNFWTFQWFFFSGDVIGHFVSNSVYNAFFNFEQSVKSIRTVTKCRAVLLINFLAYKIPI